MSAARGLGGWLNRLTPVGRDASGCGPDAQLARLVREHQLLTALMESGMSLFSADEVALRAALDAENGAVPNDAACLCPAAPRTRDTDGSVWAGGWAYMCGWCGLVRAGAGLCGLVRAAAPGCRWSYD